MGWSGTIQMDITLFYLRFCQVELLALATVLGRPLTVIQGEGQESLVVGSDQKGEHLTLTYHRHMYGLGEHYNSVIKM